MSGLTVSRVITSSSRLFYFQKNFLCSFTTRHFALNSSLPLTLSKALPILFNYPYVQNSLPLIGLPPIRTTVFTSLPAPTIWEGVTGPKGITKKRARGKRRVSKQSVDLNYGQKIGKGRVVAEMPGLNVRLGNFVVRTKIKMGDVDKDYFAKLNEYRTKAFTKRKREKLPPLLRGWSGSRIEGQSLGPLSMAYPEFNSIVLELKLVSHMIASRGRFRRFSVMVGAGNGAGVCGLGFGKAQTMRAALRQAKERAFRNLNSYNLRDGHTLWHPGYIQKWHSTIFASPYPEGRGLVCHRLLRSLCQLVGIKDMHAKVEGVTRNYRAIARGFLEMLNLQQSYQQLADNTGLHVVEFSQHNDMVPIILSSPSDGQVRKSLSYESKVNSPIQTHEHRPHPGQFEKTLIMISNPRRHPEFPVPRPELHTSFIDDLTFETSHFFAHREVQDMETLLQAGERNLDSLIVYGGRIPRLKTNPKPGYLNTPRLLKMAAIRYRFRNQDSIKRQRLAFDALDKEIST